MSIEVLVKLVAVVVVAYFLGSISFAVIISKLVAKEDVRTKGSHNAGSTNMLRNYGKKLAALTFLGDFLKGFIAAGIGLLLFRETQYANLACGLGGIGSLIGHMKPIYFGFKGGKGVATALGGVVCLNPIAFLFVAIIGIPLAGISGYVSLASSIFAGIFPFVVLAEQLFISNEISYGELITSAILGWSIVFNHRENIKRLINGTESNIRKKK